MFRVQIHNNGECRQSNSVLITERIPPRHVHSRTYDIFCHIEEPTQRNSKRGRDSASSLYRLAMTLDLTKRLSVVDVTGLLRLFIEELQREGFETATLKVEVESTEEKGEGFSTSKLK